MKKKPGNKQILGIAAGLIVPLLITYLIYSSRYFGGRDFFDFINTMITFQSLGKLLSLSVLPNLLLFFFAIWSERLLMARGILISTLLYGLVIIGMVLVG